MPRRPPAFHGPRLKSSVELRLDRQRRHDAERSAHPWRKFYKTQAWRKLRAVQLRAEPVCWMCKRDGRIVPATVADHRIPHRGDEKLFFDPANLASLCSHHHNSEKQRLERGS